ncbi:hypothetical protein Zmor_004441, partial [Zophobas morio]
IIQKGPGNFLGLTLVQQLHCGSVGAVWCIKFSHCGRLFCSAGQDSNLYVWTVNGRENFFIKMRNKLSNHLFNDESDRMSCFSSSYGQSVHPFTASRYSSTLAGIVNVGLDLAPIFCSKPFLTFSGHEMDILDICWSRNYFLLSVSLDKTVRLWHISQPSTCLCCFRHSDLVTAVAFHPSDDRYFVSASMDCKLRLWYIPHKRVSVSNEIDSSDLLQYDWLKNYL